MSKTRFAVVPVVATEEMVEATWNVPATDTQRVHAALIAAAPKELPEEVVDIAVKAYVRADAPVFGGHRDRIRAALLAVIGGE